MHPISMRQQLVRPVSLGLLVGLSACSGSVPEFTPEVDPLQAPESVSVVSVDAAPLAAAPAPVPAGSEYFLDIATVRLHEPKVDFLDTLNERLGQVALTRYQPLVNALAYRTLLDQSMIGRLVEPGRGEAVDVLRRLYRSSTNRAMNGEPQTIALRLPIDDASPRETVVGGMLVQESPVAMDRFGAMQLSLTAYPSSGSILMPARRMAFQSLTGNDGFQFVQDEGDVDEAILGPGDPSRRIQMIVQSDPMTGTGTAKVLDTIRFWTGTADSGAIPSTWRVAFDADGISFQREMDAPFAYDRSDVTYHAHSYNLYYATGADAGRRVERESGVGVVLGSGAYAWVGYDGAHVPYGESLDTGDIVTSTDGSEIYSVVSSPGRLYRATPRTLALTELGMQRFRWNELGTRHEVSYTGVEWVRVATYSSMTGEFEDLVTPTMIDVALAGGALTMWSEFLGPVVYIDLSPDLLYHETELVNGSDPLFDNGPEVELFATFEALGGEITQSEIDAGDVFMPLPANVTNAHKYRISRTDMTLYHDPVGDASVLAQVGPALAVVPTGGPNVSGMQSGPLVLGADLAGMTQVTDVYFAPTYYLYETGHNSWNGSVGLVDSADQWVPFDPPMELLYTHSTLYDLNGDMSYSGQQVVLTYRGAGRLHGIPTRRFDLDGDTIYDRSYPAFSIAPGTLVGPGGAYVIRPVRAEATLAFDPTGAPGLDPSTADPLVVPDLTLLDALEVEPLPASNAAPRVIDGAIR
ncbi:MAG: hypothetical protein AAGB93_08800 [Planctomycetota bacterium]